MTVWGRGVGRVWNKTSFVSIRVWFADGSINIIQKKQEYFIIFGGKYPIELVVVFKNGVEENVDFNV